LTGVLAGSALALVITACSGTSTTTTGAGPGGSTKAAGSAVTCPPPEGTAQRTTTFDAVPPTCIDANKTYTALVETSAGPFTVKLDPKSAPIAVNNFVFLARNHFYDGVSFHRIIPGFVIQGGDATGKPAGTGDPGYEFKDELPASADVYQQGSLAMANSGPDTNGSQFFVVLEPGTLQAKYSHFGQVTEGFDTTIQKIAKTGTMSGTPSSPTTITSVKITES
jgi:cyclophilin family peptidyl-prolyl cis-trans isomerase